MSRSWWWRQARGRRPSGLKDATARPTTPPHDPGDPINEATKALHDAGVAVVFAAGNSGPGQNTLNPYSAAPWVISVAAGCKVGSARAGLCADANGRDPVLAGFSSRGVPGDPLVHPDVTAPGALIVSGRASTGLIMTGLDAPDDVTACAIAAAMVVVCLLA